MNPTAPNAEADCVNDVAAAVVSRQILVVESFRALLRGADMFSSSPLCVSVGLGPLQVRQV